MFGHHCQVCSLYMQPISEGRQKQKPTHRWRSEKRNIVFIVLPADLKKMKAVYTYKAFTIYEHTAQSLSAYRHEIVYSGSKNMFSLLRTIDRQSAEGHIAQLNHIVPILTGGIIAAKPSICQPLVDTVINNPSWNETHVAASIGCTVFFTNTKLLPDEINAVVAPGMVTPLHLAISRSFCDTVRAIINLKPKINIVDDEGNNVLHEAASGSIEILNEILKIPGVEILFSGTNLKSLTPFSIACFDNKIANVKRFKSYGIPQNLLYISPPISNKSDKIIKYDSKTLNTFDFSNIARGGCPLHWCKDPNSVAREIKNGFNLDSLDLDQETPVLVAMKKGSSKSVIHFAAAGANVNLFDTQGNTPLHIATRRGDVNMMKTLLVFGADINLRNIYNESPLHIAASRGLSFENAYKLLLLVRPQCCEKNLLESCNKRCLEPCYLINSTIEKMTFNTMNTQRILYQKIIARTKKLTTENPVSDDLSFRTANERMEDHRNRLLTIDGGGVKGLISIQTMLELESMLQHPIHKYFDWFCGTSTGAIIATALVQGKTLLEIRKIYWHFKDEIMNGKKPFDSGKLIKLFKDELLGDLPIREMGKMFGKHLMITATNIRLHPPVLEVFRSFRNHQHISSTQETIELWEALRASTAAPMFFKSHRKFVDGGLIANNPTLDALAEFCRYKDCIEKDNEMEKFPRSVPQLELSISLGQSRVPPEKNNLVKLYDSLNMSLMSIMRSAFPGAKFLCEVVNQIKSLLLQTNEYVVNRAEAFCTCCNTLFYRISPIINLKLSLDETNDERLIEALWNVKIYATKHAAEFKEVADVLNALGPATRIADEGSEYNLTASENLSKNTQERGNSLHSVNHNSSSVIRKTE